MNDRTFSGALLESLYGAAAELIGELLPRFAERPEVTDFVVLYQCSPFNVRVVGLSSEGRRVDDLVVTPAPPAGLPATVGAFMTEGLNAMTMKDRLAIEKDVDDGKADLYVAVVPEPPAIIGYGVRRGGSWEERLVLFRLGVAP